MGLDANTKRGWVCDPNSMLRPTQGITPKMGNELKLKRFGVQIVLSIMCKGVGLLTPMLDLFSQQCWVPDGMKIREPLKLFTYWYSYVVFGSSTTWYYAPQVRPERGSNSQPPDHDSTLHVTETPALTTRPSVTSLHTVLSSTK